jgi:Flp pilus assembly protein TadB
MSTPHDHQSPTPRLKKLDLNGHEDVAGHQGHAGHGGHGWMMIICCIPMLVIAAVLVATGVLSIGFLVFALICTAMMAVMMRGMNHGG